MANTQLVGFKPHTFETEARLTAIPEPRIVITPLAFDKMWAWVDACPEEVGWVGRVQKFEEVFAITDVFLLDQDVQPALTTITEKGVRDFLMEWVVKDPNVVNEMRMWGHSHVNMGTTPSGQDEQQMQLFLNPDIDWFIRLICNKRGRMQFTILYYTLGLEVNDVPWDLIRTVDQETMDSYKAELAVKVRKSSYGRTWEAPKGTGGFNRRYDYSGRGAGQGRQVGFDSREGAWAGYEGYWGD